MSDDMVSAAVFRDPIVKLIGLLSAADKYQWSQESPVAEFLQAVDAAVVELASLLPENQADDPVVFKAQSVQVNVTGTWWSPPGDVTW